MKRTERISEFASIRFWRNFASLRDSQKILWAEGSLNRSATRDRGCHVLLGIFQPTWYIEKICIKPGEKELSIFCWGILIGTPLESHAIF